jgi:hypothetical protein
MWNASVFEPDVPVVRHTRFASRQAELGLLATTAFGRR